ncbi:MAG: NB-ARC domain-containing protein [Candidatus Hermodarchaeota archaeon]
MQTELNLFQGIQRLCSHHNILSISGKSGTGKTTLALHLIGKLLTKNDPFTDSCIWIQASEKFPVRRLTQIFEDSSQESDYIRNNIYIIPQKGLIHTYEEQTSLLKKIINPKFNKPPFLKYIVIDNISHHLRYKISHYNTPKDISSLLDSFYDTLLMPLIIFCKRNEIVLILIHEVTYSPKLEKVRPFFYKLYDRIRTIDIVLSKVNNDEKKNLLMNFNGTKWKFQFILKQEGIILI